MLEEIWNGILELTSKCNLRCGMCPLPVLRRPYEDMEWSLVEKAEREIHGNGFKMKWLHEMGEPLLYPRIGDAVLSSGLIRRLHDEIPNARFTIAAGPLAAPLFADTPGLERVIVMDKEKGGGHWFRLWRQVRGRQWGMIVMSSMTCVLTSKRSRVRPDARRR